MIVFLRMLMYLKCKFLLNVRKYFLSFRERKYYKGNNNIHKLAGLLTGKTCDSVQTDIL